MKKLLSVLLCAALFILTASVATAKHGRDDHPRRDADKFNDSERVDWAVKKVRKATEKYKDINKALADGYQLHSPLVPNMGYHYVKHDLVDNLSDALHPEALLYVPTEDGGYELVAVEYMSVSENSLFGKTFDAPSPPFVPEFTLHAWIWEPNPHGMFAPFNPNVANPN